MNRTFKYSVVLAGLSLLAVTGMPIQAQEAGGDEFFVPPHPVTTVETSDDPTSEEASSASSSHVKPSSNDPEIDQALPERVSPERVSPSQASKSTTVEDSGASAGTVTKQADAPDSEPSTVTGRSVISEPALKPTRSQSALTTATDSSKVGPSTGSHASGSHFKSSGTRTGTVTADVKAGSFVQLTPDYQNLFNIYAKLSQVRAGESLDQKLLQNLDSLVGAPVADDLYVRAYSARIKARAALLTSGRTATYVGGISDDSESSKAEATEKAGKGTGNGASGRRRGRNGSASSQEVAASAENARSAPVGQIKELSERLISSAYQDLEFVNDWLKIYDRRSTIHGVLEPAWLHGRLDVASQAVLAMADLEVCHPDRERREAIRKLAEGLVICTRSNTMAYPYGAHLSYVTSEGQIHNYKIPQSEDMASGVTILPERQYAVAALVRAYQVLRNDDFLQSAQAEGTGLLTKLALSGRVPYSLAPRPENEAGSILGTAAVVENLLALKKATGNNVYGTLAGCAAVNLRHFSDKGDNSVVKNFVNSLLKNNGCGEWVGAEDLCRPFESSLIELEDGKAVDKAFDVYDISYPGGTPGQFIQVGRDNMFWMRFDVDREDPYYFSLNFLKSNFSGALVSIMARIDGDQIFRVNLGGATDDSFVDSVFIDGPRHLRQGPHSVGVRFAGLLMKSPAILDSIIVDPAINRRWVKLNNGKSVLVMHSIADKDLKTRMQELEDKSAPTPSFSIFNKDGAPVSRQVDSDKRGRMWLDMPGGGLAVWEWPTGRIPGLELAKGD